MQSTKALASRGIMKHTDPSLFSASQQRHKVCGVSPGALAFLYFLTATEGVMIIVKSMYCA